MGCFKDDPDRQAIGSLEGLDRLLDTPVEDRVDPILKCYHAARDRGFTVFALQEGSCMSSRDGELTYSIYGSGGEGCVDGKGGPQLNNVYFILKSGRPGIGTPHILPQGCQMGEGGQ